MQIDVSAQIETAKRLTREWADRAGYKRPPEETEALISKKANDLRRILAASSFGCQERNVHALLEALIDEKIPLATKRALVDYAAKEPFAVGSILVPANVYDGSQYARAGIVTRLSQSGNAGLRKSNGEMHNNHYQQNDLRPATEDEIDAYFSEFYGISVNPADVPPVETEAEDYPVSPDPSIPF
jgi:hypothetical protein